MHIRVVLLEPFLALFDSTPELAILNQAFVSAETPYQTYFGSVGVGRYLSVEVPLAVVCRLRTTESALITPRRMYSSTRTVSHLRSRQCGELEVPTMPLELLSLPTSWMNPDSA